MSENQNILLILLSILDGKKSSLLSMATLLGLNQKDFFQEIDNLCHKDYLLQNKNGSIVLQEKGKRHYSKKNIEKLCQSERFHTLGRLFLSNAEEYNEVVRKNIEKLKELLKEGKALTAATLLKVILFSAQNKENFKGDLLTIKDYINNTNFLIIISIYLRLHIRAAKELALNSLKLAEEIQDKRSIVLLESWLSISDFYQDNTLYFNIEKNTLKTIRKFSELNDSELAVHLGISISVFYFITGSYGKITILDKKIKNIKMNDLSIYIQTFIDVFFTMASTFIGDSPAALGRIKYAIKTAKSKKQLYSELYLTNHYCTILCYMERFEEAYAIASSSYKKLSPYEQPQLFFSNLALQALSLYKLNKKEQAFTLMDELFSHFEEEDDFSIMPTNSIYFLEIMFHYSYHTQSQFVGARFRAIIMNFLKSTNPYHVGQAKRILALNLLRRSKDKNRVLLKINESIRSFQKVGAPFEVIKSELIKAQVYEEKNYTQAYEYKIDVLKRYNNYKNLSFQIPVSESSDRELINRTHNLLTEIPPCRSLLEIGTHIAYIIGNIFKAERVLLFEQKENTYQEIVGYNFNIEIESDVNTVKNILIQRTQNYPHYFYSNKDNYMVQTLQLQKEEKEYFADFLPEKQNKISKSRNVQSEFNSVFDHLDSTYKNKNDRPLQWCIYADGEHKLQSLVNPHSIEIIGHLLSTFIYAEYNSLSEQRTNKTENTLKEANTLNNENISLVTHSPKFQDCLEQVNMVAESNSNIILLGETGVGKEVLARHIHKMSKRKGNFIAINPASISGSLFESEFFGHEKGAFTGATSQKKGFFELAHEGTLFIDEVGDIPLSMQVKLLRVLEEKSFMRVGSMKEIKSTFRLITATNVDLHKVIDEGSFRSDFFYRLSTFPINIPPLRERIEDLDTLIPHMVKNIAKTLRKDVPTPSFTEIKKLKQYTWKGNIRELKNTIERAIIFHSHGELALASFIPQQNTSVEGENYSFPHKNKELTNYEYSSGEKSIHSEKEWRDQENIQKELCGNETYKNNLHKKNAILEVEEEIFALNIPSMKEMQEKYFRYVLEKTGGKILGENSVESILQMKKSTIYAKLKEYNITKKYQ